MWSLPTTTHLVRYCTALPRFGVVVNGDLGAPFYMSTPHRTVDNVEDLAHHFFSRCLSGLVVPYVVTKKTVFKWQAS